jgi:hypothetical protein
MKTLTENEHQLIQNYTELLYTVDEAFTYLMDSSNQFKVKVADRTLNDIYSAFNQMAIVNDHLACLFDDQEQIEDVLISFDKVVIEMARLEADWDKIEAKQLVIQNKLYPEFAAWSTAVQKEILPFIES